MKYRVVIKKGSNLKIGLNSYTYEEAVEAKNRLIKVGHKNIIILSEEECFKTK